MTIAEDLMAPTLNCIIKDRVYSLHRDPQLRHASIFVHNAVRETVENFYDQTNVITYKLAIRRVERERADLAFMTAPHGLELSRKERDTILTARLHEMAMLHGCVKYMRGDITPTPYLAVPAKGLAFVVDHAVVNAQQQIQLRPAVRARRLFPAIKP